ncbi:hypothetical protein CPB83DRAFT_909158 [Crepidotus variabilis]|uniref:F-box domain-containing protein n=1 Tax=Crepidotus variabilis TaxID=179855 RepID=A0A9P6JM07_9AGAR|nr:hypothetical protein CPB83DRAFT_909158 [Crepidotus variabilis]
MSTLQYLPNEILGLIFEHLYLLNRQPIADPQDTREMDWECANFKSPDLFPWVLFRVCQRWGYIAAHYPHFWTRLAFDLASPEALPLAAFEWSKDYLFEVLVFDSRSLETPQTSEMVTGAISGLSMDERASLERKIVQAITMALYPHLPRCTSLEYDVKYGSSLPYIPSLLHHDPNLLNSIKLKYTTTNILGPRHLNSSTHLEKAVTLMPFKSIDAVSLPIEAFISVGRIDPHIWNTMDRKLTLALYNYQFCSKASSQNSGTASIAEFLRYFTSLTRVCSLTLRNLSVRSLPELAISDSEPDIQLQPNDWTYGFVQFENLSKKFLEILLEGCEIFSDTGAIKNCKLPKNSNYLNIMELSLYDLPRDAKPGRVVKDYGGSTIQFHSCHYLDNQVFQLLAGRQCNLFKSLHLVDCDGYSIRALKDLVIARGELAGTTDDSNSGVYYDTPMESMLLDGNGPKLSPADIQWFSLHLESFYCS